MNDSQKHKYKLALERALVEIEEYLSKSEDSAEAVAPDKSLGRLSRMEAMQDQQMVLELRRRRKRRRLEIVNALNAWKRAFTENASYVVWKLAMTDWRHFLVQTCVSQPKFRFANPFMSITKRYFTLFATRRSKA